MCTSPVACDKGCRNARPESFPGYASVMFVSVAAAVAANLAPEFDNYETADASNCQVIMHGRTANRQITSEGYYYCYSAIISAV